ncbi:DUF2987 domain-containing protein [Ferrimonas pelagia]|uniref:DUF2987 domain-containing protein n=2 Tax=Ferrimonas pelagia TaxID=1177826 RepID=A0ABP9EUK5_9GAMM
MCAGAVALALAMTPTTAQALILEYAGFYDRMKVVNKTDYPLVTLAFYLNHRQQGHPCVIRQAELIHKEMRLPVGISPRYELLLPFDPKLKLDKAVLALSVDDESQCDFAMQLRFSDPLQQAFSGAELDQLASQFDAVLKRFAGFPFRFLQPDVSGVVVQLAPDSLMTDQRHVSQRGDAQGRITLTQQQLVELETLRFSEPPLWIGPYIER